MKMWEQYNSILEEEIAYTNHKLDLFFEKAKNAPRHKPLINVEDDKENN